MLEHEGGVSPAWPISYDDLEPYYNQAESIYGVHGSPGDDLTEPPRSQSYPFPAVPDEPYVAELRQALQAQNLHPFFLPMGIDLRDGGRCIRCKTCDGFPCKVDAKSDADMRCVRPAMQANDDITLWTQAYVRRLLTDVSGKKITAVEVEKDGQVQQVSANRIIVSCGAVNSAGAAAWRFCQ